MDISSPRKLPNLASIVSDLVDADRMLCISFFATAIREESSIVCGNWDTSMYGPPRQFLWMYIVIGGGDGAEVSASGDCTSITITEFGPLILNLLTKVK